MWSEAWKSEMIIWYILFSSLASYMQKFQMVLTGHFVTKIKSVKKSILSFNHKPNMSYCSDRTKAITQRPPAAWDFFRDWWESDCPLGKCLRDFLVYPKSVKVIDCAISIFYNHAFTVQRERERETLCKILRTVTDLRAMRGLGYWLMRLIAPISPGFYRYGNGD